MSQACLIIPCYNEAERLPLADFRMFLEEQESIDLLFVDDGSRDTTLERLRTLEGPRAQVLSLHPNGGKAEAVRAGMHQLRGQPYEWLGYLDADLATPLAEMQRMLTLAGPPRRFLFGSRIQTLGTTVRRNLVRHWLGRCMATCISAAVGLQVYDTQCGAKLIHASLLETLFAEPFLSRWLFDVELLARLKASVGTPGVGEQALEIPLQTWTEVPGSKLRMRDALPMLVELVRIRLWRPGQSRPQ